MIFTSTFRLVSPRTKQPTVNLLSVYLRNKSAVANNLIKSSLPPSSGRFIHTSPRNQFWRRYLFSHNRLAGHHSADSLKIERTLWGIAIIGLTCFYFDLRKFVFDFIPELYNDCRDLIYLFITEVETTDSYTPSPSPNKSNVTPDNQSVIKSNNQLAEKVENTKTK